VRAAAAAAGILGAALADLPFGVDRGLPGSLGELADRGLLAAAQRPPDGPGDLVPVPAGEPVELLDQPVAGAGPVAGDHDLAAQRGREGPDRLAQEPQVIGGGVRPGGAGPEHPGQRLAGVIAGSQQRMMPFS
jgi:hypothetical protein